MRLVRRRALAHEAGGLHVRLLLSAVARADLRHRRRRVPFGGHLAARARRTVRLALAHRIACAGVLAPGGFGRGGGGDFCGRVLPRDALRSLAEKGDADDADVLGTPGARRIGIGQRREIERRSGGDTRAPAVDVGALVSAQDVARLRGRRGLARQDVDAVDAHHGQQAFAGRVAHADPVFLAGRADHVAPAVLRVHRQHAAVGTRHDVDAAELPGEGAAGAKGQRDGKGERAESGMRAFRTSSHDRSPKESALAGVGGGADVPANGGLGPTGLNRG